MTSRVTRGADGVRGGDRHGPFASGAVGGDRTRPGAVTTDWVVSGGGFRRDSRNGDRAPARPGLRCQPLAEDPCSADHERRLEFTH
jgi:hypothetical protein